MSYFVRKTMQIEIAYHPSVDFSQPAIYCFWHGQQFIPIMVLREIGNHPYAALVSLSKDGDKLAICLKKLGYAIARGSSSRGGATGLVKMLRMAKKGYSLGIAADGPRGPLYQVKPGAIYLAAKSGLPIIPLGSVYQHKWQFKAWDKYQLPKPFSKAALYFGEPISITKQMMQDSPEQLTFLLEQQLHISQAKAGGLLSSRPVPGGSRWETLSFRRFLNYFL